MPSEVIMPALGMAQETGRLLNWFKQEGETIERGEILMEVETDKTTVEVEATASGTLAAVTAQAGDDIPVGQVIAYILAEGETAPSAASKTPAPAPDTKPTEPTPEHSSKIVTPVAMRIAQAHNVDLSAVQGQGERITRADIEAYINHVQPVRTNGHGRILASPKARRLANERQIDIALIPGSGPGQAVVAADVLNFEPAPALAMATAPAASSTPSPAATGTMWRRMAERLTESWQTIPHFYLKRDVSAESLITWRNQLKGRSATNITFTDLLVKLVAVALKQHPYANGQWNGESVIFNEQINVGLAVAVDEGLIVPVIHNADTLGVTLIAQKRAEIVERAQHKKLQLADLQGGTFTISNLGMYGIDEFNAIVNPPQAAILAVGRIADRAVPVAGQVVVRPMLMLSLSCDHRAIDGARGAQYLDTLANLIQNPLAVLD